MPTPLVGPGDGVLGVATNCGLTVPETSVVIPPLTSLTAIETSVRIPGGSSITAGFASQQAPQWVRASGQIYPLGRN